jgi:predicted CxxxxCH...CXXCH cytochrome family protein
MGFSSFIGAQQGGSYDGQAGVNYNATSTTPVTSVANTGVKTCSSIYCHSTGQSTSDKDSAVPTYTSPVWDNPSTGDCGTCHEINVGSVVSGSHDQHLNATGVDGCGNCHTGAENDASAYNSGNHVNASIDVANSYTAGGTPGNDYGTCSTASCHDDGTGSTVVTPIWGSSPDPCTACHAEVPGTGSHQKHVVTTLYNKAVCGNCHDGAVRASTAPAQHLDGDLDVYDVSAGDLGYPQDVAKGGAPYDSCSTVYCHSTGQSTSDGSDSTPTYSTPAWGGSAACGTCHEVNVGSVVSGSHDEHLNASIVNGCGDCHTGAADNGSSYNSILHVDGTIDVANTYSAGGAPGNGYGYCSTALCHDNGTGSIVNTPTWGSAPQACSACHDPAPNTGSHSEHLAESGVACNDCHDNAVQGTTAPTQHLDSNIDVFDASSGDLGYPSNKTKGTAYSTCSTAACHSNGLGTYKTTPTWGTSTSGCNFCHNALPTSGSHSKHVIVAASAYGSTSVNSTSGNYDFGCGNCHPVNASNHRNGSLDITLNKNHAGTLKSNNNVTDDVSGYNQTPGTTVTCSAAYCHSDTNGTFATTPNWYSGLFEGDVCANCHGNSPASNAHGIHVVGIHYSTIYTGTSGLIAGSGASGAGHGDPGTSTTVNCNICHNDTLTVSRNDNNTVCNTCHNGEGNALASSDLDKSKHVNGTPDIAFVNATIRSRAQIRDDITTVSELNTYWQRNNSYKAGATSHDSSKATLSSTASFSSGTCSSVACHNGNSVNWNTNITCDACHTTLPATN